MKSTEVRQHAATFEFRDVDTHGRVMRGHVATYGKVYDVGAFTERLMPGVFSKSIAEGARSLPLLANHDHSEIPVGKTVGWEDTHERLIGMWEFDSRTEAREMARLVEEGYMTGLSVGFHPLPSRSKWDTSGVKPHVDRYEARMLETSLCSVPAYDDAGVLALRSAGLTEMPETVIVPTPHLDEMRSWLASLKR